MDCRLCIAWVSCFVVLFHRFSAVGDWETDDGTLRIKGTEPDRYWNGCLARAFSGKQARIKLEQRDWKLLHQQMRASGLEQKGGLLALVMLVVFFLGLALGSSLLPRRAAIQQLASNQPMGAAFLIDRGPQPF